MTTLGLRLDPLDTLFFRDGRPFDPASRAAGGLPQPQTLAGALRTYLLTRAGVDLTAFARLRRQDPAAEARSVLQSMDAPPAILDLRFRGPWLALAGVAGLEPLLPVPASLAVGEGGQAWVRSDPLPRPLPGWREGDLLPLWRRSAADARHPGGFLTPEGVRRFLDGGVPAQEDWLAAVDLYDFDSRTGIEIDPASLTAAEGRLYGIRLLRLRPRLERRGPHQGKEVCLYAEVLGAGAAELAFDGPLPFGGEGRHVQVSRLERPVAWPPAEVSERSLWLLATPAFLKGPRPLPGVEPAKLVAAASRAPVAVSGWDVARGGPRPTRFAVPAGSVYFVEGSVDPPQQSLCSDAEDVAQGWGFVLRGRWNHA